MYIDVGIDSTEIINLKSISFSSLPPPSPMLSSSDPWNTPLSFPQNSSLLVPVAQQNRKPRHRHSPAQLAALNDLFDKSEHPPLDQRTELAERLGM